MKVIARITSGLVLGVASVSAAGLTVIDNYGAWNGSIADGWLKNAQSFTVGQDNVLKSWAFTLGNGGTSYTFSVVNITNGLPNESSYLYQTTRSWLSGSNLIDDINLQLISNQQYAVVIDFNGFAGNSVAFSYTPNSSQYLGGHAFWLTTAQYFPAYGTGQWLGVDGGKLAYDGGLGTETKFQAQFVSAIPEPETYALLLIGLGALTLRLKRRRTGTNQAKPPEASGKVS